ncbi:MAG: hypothetical protein ACK4ME_12255, partial [Fimbriimonadales bacterium]
MSRSRGSRSRGMEGDGHSPLLMGLMLAGALMMVSAAGWWFVSYSRAQTLKTPLAVAAAFDVSQSVST